MNKHEPSADFLFFEPAEWVERLFTPILIFICAVFMIDQLFFETHRLLPGKAAFRSGLTASVVLAVFPTLYSLNVHWAYKGRFSRHQSRPLRVFLGGNVAAGVVRHVVLLAVFSTIIHCLLCIQLPRVIVNAYGEPVVREVLVTRKGRSSSVYIRCTRGVDATSPGLREDYLCLDPIRAELYDMVAVGDVLIVEGRANWAGLILDEVVAVRDGETVEKRLVDEAMRQSTWESRRPLSPPSARSPRELPSAS